jgi:DNA-binding FadR family transcriptional regulator
MFKKIKQNRMFEEIVNQVFESMLRGDLKPNDKLPSEKELGQIFGVSRVTVREAIRSLEQFGAIEVRQGSMGGAYLKEMDIDAVVQQTVNAFRMTNITFQHLTEARSVLEETILGKLISSNNHDRNFKKLDESIVEAKKHFKNYKNRDRLRANFRFHSIIAEMTENPIIIFMHKLIVDFSFYFFENVEPSISMIEKTFIDHEKIVELLKQGEFENASNACSTHIMDVSAQIMEKSKKQSLINTPV